MKRFISTIAAVLYLIFLTGCSSAESSPIQESTAQYSCKELADTVLNSVEFPGMMEVTESAMLDSIIDFSDYGITDYCVYQQMMSVHLCEIIIVRSNDTEAVLKALNDRKDKLINQLAFYPEQQDSANATVVGKKGSVCYLIAHTDAAEAEKALLRQL